MTTGHPQDVLAAGIVVVRPGKRVLLVHRPKYDDWSFPKGKLERGEHAVSAAVREVAEETGLHVRLCLPIPGQRYRIANGRMKRVFYWTGRVVGDDDVSHYLPNDEIDRVEWLEAEDAVERLTYPHDRVTLGQALKVRRRTHAVVVLRHGQARSRRAWRRDDRERPLLRAGEQQADRLVPLLAAYDVTRVISSSSIRCLQTVEPFASMAGWPVESDPRLSEEDASAKRVRRMLDDVLVDERGTVVCTHRPVLPSVFEALGVRDPELAPGEMLVAHVRKGAVVGVERHLPR